MSSDHNNEELGVPPSADQDLPSPGRLSAYARIVRKYGLTELEVAKGATSVVLRVSTAHPAGVALSAASHLNPVSVAPAPLEATRTHDQASSDTTESPSSEPLLADQSLLRSKVVGIAYVAPQPGAQPYVVLGQRVKEGDIVLLIEAMKVMNQVTAHRSGEVKRLFVHDGEPVEYDQPLLAIV